MKYEILLFDLLGVLLTDSRQAIQEFLGVAGMNKMEFFQYFTASPTSIKFHLGKSSSQEFGESVVRDLKLSISATEFLELFRSWVGGLYDGTEALLSELSQRYSLGCFSNNNEIYWPQMRDQLGMGRLLNYYFLSHEIGMLKPDLAAFEHVIQQLGIEPDRIAFFDDEEVNVMSARKVGMNAFVTKGPQGVREQLKLLGVL
jgi:glucose-1-phosphatase